MTTARSFVVIFLAHKAAGILAEGAHLVFEGAGIADELGFIEHLVDQLHDLAAHLDAHADVHGAGLMGDAVLGANFFQPVCAAPSRGDDGVLRAQFPLARRARQQDAHAARALDEQVAALVAKEDFHAGVEQVVLDVFINLLGALGAQMPDGAVDQLEAGANGALADFFELLPLGNAFHLLVGAKLEVNGVGIINGLLCQRLANQGGQVSPHFAGERELAVGKGTGPRKAGGDVTIGLAVDAAPRDCLGAVAVLHCLPFFHNGDVPAAAVAQQLNGRENSGRAGADDDDVVVFQNSQAPFFLKGLRCVRGPGNGFFLPARRWRAGRSPHGGPSGAPCGKGGGRRRGSAASSAAAGAGQMPAQAASMSSSQAFMASSVWDSSSSSSQPSISAP